jgi:hypothetical protein
VRRILRFGRRWGFRRGARHDVGLSVVDELMTREAWSACRITQARPMYSRQGPEYDFTAAMRVISLRGCFQLLTQLDTFPKCKPTITRLTRPVALGRKSS